MQLWVPVALPQLWLFGLVAVPFLFLVARMMWRRGDERDTTRKSKSRLGIIIQAMGLVAAAVGPIHPGRPWLSPVAIVSYIAIFILVGGAGAIFAASSAALGKNWSFQARTLSDHELVRRGPYARVRHPIYSGCCSSCSEWRSPTGTPGSCCSQSRFSSSARISALTAEDRLLERHFGDEFQNTGEQRQA